MSRFDLKTISRVLPVGELLQRGGLLSRNALLKTRARLAPFVVRTPVLQHNLDLPNGQRVWLKMKPENLQHIGAFKFRGATNAVQMLSPEQLQRGVTTHSSGNHAAALALAAKQAGTRAIIVVPKTAPAVKVEQVQSLAEAEVRFCEPTLEARETAVAAVMKETGSHMIHPYNDYNIIAGQATAAAELLEDTNGCVSNGIHTDGWCTGELDLLLCPVGGGGLCSGTAVAVRHFAPHVQVIGVEPCGADGRGDDACRSFSTGKLQPSTNPTTVADGLRTSLGDKTFPLLRALVHDIVSVDEEAIQRALRYIWRHIRIVVEPSSAVVLAALFDGKIALPEDTRVGLILSGGNVDLPDTL